MNGVAPVVRWAVAIVVIVGLSWQWNRQISEAPIVKDAAQVVQMAVDLSHHGVMSRDEHAPFRPSDYREPLPVFTAALAIRLVDAVQGPAEPSAYLSGPRVRALKYQNLIWLGLLALGAFYSVRALGGGFYAAWVGVVLVNLRFLSFRGGGGEIDDLLTEIPAAAVLIWASIALSHAFSRRQSGWFVLAGVLLGGLALIKAAILYVFAGVVGVWLAANLWSKSAPLLLRSLREALILAVAFGVVVGPWMVRNLTSIGTFEISQRAGVVLLYRALYDGMTPVEYRGAFYLWAPHALQAPIGRVLGFSPADAQRAGRLHRLNDDLHSDFAAEDLAAEVAGRPDQAISYYREARARREQAQSALEAVGRSETEAETEADRILKRESLAIFREHPGRHLAATLPFMWRGAFQTFPILLGCLLAALWLRRYDVAGFALTALGILGEYALFTHFIPRYDEPANAVANVALVAMAVILWREFRRRHPAR